jgi:hypothetical protein
VPGTFTLRCQAPGASLLLVATLLAVLVAAVPAAASPCDAQRRSAAVKHRPRAEGPPLIIGDSTMILAARLLGRRGLVADARGCRQFASGVAMLARRRARGRLPRVAILALGTNGPMTRRTVVRAVRVMGPYRVLGLVTPRKAPASAAALRWAARRFGDRVLLIDWVRFSAGHRGWFAGDGLHVGHDGARAFADLVRRRVAPLVHPPVGRLRLPREPARAGKACGRRVFVTRGAERIACTRARELARATRLRPLPGWRFFDLRGVRRRPWTGAWMRRDGRVVVAIA